MTGGGVHIITTLTIIHLIIIRITLIIQYIRHILHTILHIILEVTIHTTQVAAAECTQADLIQAAPD